LRIGLNVIAMLLAFIALIHLGDIVVGFIGRGLSGVGMNATAIGLDLANLTLKDLFGLFFAPVAWLLGVPLSDAHTVGKLMGEKMAINEFFAYMDMSNLLKDPVANHFGQQAETIATFALCGFANLSSVAMQIGGIGEIAPSRRADLARLGVK